MPHFKHRLKLVRPHSNEHVPTKQFQRRLIRRLGSGKFQIIRHPPLTHIEKAQKLIEELRGNALEDPGYPDRFRELEISIAILDAYIRAKIAEAYIQRGDLIVELHASAPEAFVMPNPAAKLVGLEPFEDTGLLISRNVISMLFSGIDYGIDRPVIREPEGFEETFEFKLEDIVLELRRIRDRLYSKIKREPVVFVIIGIPAIVTVAGVNPTFGTALDQPHAVPKLAEYLNSLRD